MSILRLLCAFVIALSLLGAGLGSRAQEPNSSAKAADQSADNKGGRAYSGMYTFLKEGEFVQVTVEDEGHVTGFISRYGNGDSDKGEFLNQFFKTGKLDSNKLNFTTEIVHGVSFDFKGNVERGEGKNPGDESYFVLRGILTENISDASKKVTSHSRDVLFKLFPQEATPSAIMRK